MKQAFITKRFNSASMVIIDRVGAILDDYRRQGYTLTLRQLYYQLVSRGFIENTEHSYKNTGSLVSDARLAGMIDWGMIEDRGREQVVPPHWSSPADIIDSAASSFHIDKWADQPCRVIVLVEKQALEGILVPECRSLDVSFMSNKGYSSSSAMYELAGTLARYQEDGRDVHVLYLGDHDPSGIDMTRDVQERLELFMGSSDFKVHRLALNYDQVEVLRPPENPAKTTDSRYERYRARFGTSSWELDAIEPNQLVRLVRDEVEALRDDYLWKVAQAQEKSMRTELKMLAADYRKKHRED